MSIRTEVKQSDYYDSVTLMLVAKELLELSFVADAAVVMATAANKDILDAAGLLTAAAATAGPDDLIIAVRADDDHGAQQALQRANELLVASRQRQRAGSPGARRVRSLSAALHEHPAANLVVISVAGPFAAAEAHTALTHHRHVMLFSDNVPLADEIALKRLAIEQGLLCMGPDAGTAIINGVGLGFANAVPRGPVGIVGAAGTGIQGVTSALARLGTGVSQAIGTGGRDLSRDVGGVTMQQGLRALQDDPQTTVIVLISKPPDPDVATRILRGIARSDKPVVVCMLGGDPSLIEAEGGIAATTLEEAAQVAAVLVAGEPASRAKGRFHRELQRLTDVAASERAQRTGQWLRGLFSGGTFCYEAQMLLAPLVGTVHSNAPFPAAQRLANALTSVEHTCVDLGEDEFTQGRLHPMLDPTLRNRRIVQEASDPAVAAILFDVVLGYGAHPDPAGAVVPAVIEARNAAASASRHVSFVASVCGTVDDPQNLADQETKLRQAGVLVLPSNAAAATLAGLIVRGPDA